MTVFVALLPLLAVAGPVTSPSPTMPSRAGSASVLRAPAPPIRMGPEPGRPSTRMALRAPPDLDDRTPTGAGVLSMTPAMREGVTGAECQPGFCQSPQAPGDPNPPRVSRRDLFLALLARTPFDPISSAATAIADSPLQVDYAPGGTGRERGWGKVSVGLRWRLDATGPVGHDDDVH